MKICLISFDYWGYDEKIAEELLKMGYETTHIKLSNFKYDYKSKGEKIFNFFSKNILNKNIKKIKTEEYIFSRLKNEGSFDKIIAINPERISKSCHLKIKTFTKTYIAYLYDSLSRYDNRSLIDDNIFDKTLTFDKKDAQDYKLIFLSNYMHLTKKALQEKPAHKIVSISSIDDRYDTINTIVNYFDQKSIKHETIFFGKRKPKNLKDSILFTKHKLSQNQVQEKIEDAEIILDVLREKQTGLSFRIFDALALDKKIITTNKTILEYDFYNPNNILIIDKTKIDIPESFLNSEYEAIPENIYKKYTLNSWIKNLISE